MRALPPSLVLVLLLVALAAPTAHAQLPDIPRACGPLELSVTTSPPGAVQPGQAVATDVTVRNTGNASMTVTVAASVAEGTGWRLTSANSQDAAIASDQSKTFSFTVTPGGAEAAQEASVNFVASGECQAGALTCPQGQDACRTSGTASALVTMAEPEGFVIPGLDQLDVPPELLLGGLLLAGAAALIPLATRRKRTGFDATCPEPLKLLRPGHGVSFPVDLRNRGKDPITVAFDVGAVPAEWSAFMAMPDVQLGPQEKRSVWLMVRAPASAAAGAAVDVPIRLRAGESKTVLRVRAEIDPNAAAPKGGPVDGA